MKSGQFWVAVGAIGALLGGVAAVIAVIRQPSTSSLDESAAFFLNACKQRVIAINERAAQRGSNGQFAMTVSDSTSRCECQSRVLSKSFDPQTIREIGLWFNAVAAGGAERAAEDAFFADWDPAKRLQVENAYDFSTRECNKILR